MGNQSSAGMATAGAALGVILAFLIEKAVGSDLPDTVEGSIVTFTTFAFTFFLPSFTTEEPK